MGTALPQVMFPDLVDGQEMTAELAADLDAYVLDGNHRLKAALVVYKNDPNKTIQMSCYRDIEDPFTKKIISDGEKEETDEYILIVDVHGAPTTSV